MNSGGVVLFTAIIGAVCGILGTVLGIINTLHQLNKNKIRLKVAPIHAFPGGALANSSITFGIEVVNLSDFATTISDIGFLLKNKNRATLFAIDSIDMPSKLPVRLKPRESYTKYFNIEQIGLSKQTEFAYVATQCGELVTGTSGALKQKIKEIGN